MEKHRLLQGQLQQKGERNEEDDGNKEEGGMGIGGNRVGNDALAVVDGLNWRPGVGVGGGGAVVGEVRIGRDEETGEVVVVEDTTATGGANNRGDGSGRRGNTAWGPPLNDSDDEDADKDEDEGSKTHNHKHKHNGGQLDMSLGYVSREIQQAQQNKEAEGDDGVVSELVRLAASGRRKDPRKPSEREADWIGRMVERHGDDYEAMFRDRELNVWQQSVGDIKKRVKRWRTLRRSRGG